MLSRKGSLDTSLLRPQNTRSLLLSRLFALISSVKGDGVAVVSAQVVEVLDLIDTDNPVFTGEGFFQSRELRAFGGEFGPTYTVSSLAHWEKLVEVVVRHFVPAHHSQRMCNLQS